ncbi:hypothetical protein VCHC59A1_0302B, partial [Vibrio cholerae HC-59A1]
FVRCQPLRRALCD